MVKIPWIMKIHLFLYDHWKVISVVILLYCYVLLFSFLFETPAGMPILLMIYTPMIIIGILSAFYLMLLIHINNRLILRPKFKIVKNEKS